MQGASMLGKYAQQKLEDGEEEEEEPEEGQQKQKTVFEFEGEGMGGILGEAYKAGNNNRIDTKTFRQMMMKKGFTGPKYLAKNKKAGSPRNGAQSTRFDELHKERETKEDNLKS